MIARSVGILAEPPFETLRLVGQKFAVVAGQDNQFAIELTSDQIRKFGEHE